VEELNNLEVDRTRYDAWDCRRQVRKEIWRVMA
jgi:hypothetical protein